MGCFLSLLVGDGSPVPLFNAKCRMLNCGIPAGNTFLYHLAPKYSDAPSSVTVGAITDRPTLQGGNDTEQGWDGNDHRPAVHELSVGTTHRRGA